MWHVGSACGGWGILNLEYTRTIERCCLFGKRKEKRGGGRGVWPVSVGLYMSLARIFKGCEVDDLVV